MKQYLVGDFEINGENCQGCGFKIDIMINDITIYMCGLFRIELKNKRCEECFYKFGYVDHEKEKQAAKIAMEKGIMTYADYLEIMTAPSTEKK